MKVIRQDQIYKADERAKNKNKLKRIRQNEQYKIKELMNNKNKKRKLRDDPNFLIQEKRHDVNRKKKLRLDDLFRYRENYRTIINDHIKNRMDDDDDYDKNVIIMKYLKNEKIGPDIICVCCDNLFFPKSTQKFQKTQIENKLKDKVSNIDEFMKNVVNNSSEFICKTCTKYIISGKIPKMAANSDLRFPVLPETVRCLSAVEERMVSPYIPFMQLKELQKHAINSQLSLKGSIVNIPVEINEMISTLPRTFDCMSTIQIKLKRHLDHKSDYMYETIRPSKVCEALQYLQTTPLYIQNKINVDPTFFEQYENNADVELDFIVDHNDTHDSCVNNNNNTVTKLNDCNESDSESDSEKSDPLLNDEVLILDRNREISTDVQIIAPGQDKFPIPWHLTENIDELCFPKIFGGEILDKKKRLTYSDRVKFEARHKDRRSCDPTRILFMAKQKLEKSVISSINICLRKVKHFADLTAETVKNSDFVNDSIRHDDGYRFLKQIRSSPSYWESKKKHLLGMIRQCGIPTLFITFSVCETKNVELLKILYKIRYQENISSIKVVQMDMIEKTKLIRDDPVTCVRYSEERFNNIMSILENEHGPFGKNYVVDYFQRREFQARGSVHTHNLVYCKDAPIYNEDDPSSTNSVVEWIDDIISCAYEINNPLILLQKHRHTPTCYKGRKNTSSCRFNIPIFVMKQTMILTPLNDGERTERDIINLKKVKEMMKEFFENDQIVSFDDMLNHLCMTEEDYIRAIRSSLSITKIFLKRRSNEVAINAYNKTILTLLEANMDIQFVLDPYSCASYMINYVTKIDAGLSRLLRETAKEIEAGNVSIRQKFKSIANVFINGNTLSAQEAVYHVLGLSLSLCSRATVYINTVPQNDRVRMLKSGTELEKEEHDSKNIYKKSIFDKYQARCKSLEQVCLADFAALYENKKGNIESDGENDDDILIHHRQKSKIIQFRRYKLQQDKYNYFREQVLLFLPWRNEIDDVENDECETIYVENLKTIEENRKKYSIVGDHVIESALLEAQDMYQDREDEEVESFMKTRVTKDQEVDIFGQTGTVQNPKTNKRRISCPPKISKEDMLSAMTKLNNKQRQIVMHVLHCFKTDHLPIRIFMSGSAGVGKSMVINCVYQLLQHYFDEQPGDNNNSTKILLCAPSGKAAFLINGVTLHTAFALPITQYGGQMPELSADVANTIRENLFHLKLLIIDEISMVGSTMLSRVDTRLRQIMGRAQSFGGVSVMVVGDLYQLPPVMDSPVYLTPKSSMLSIFSENVLWNEFQFFELTEIMRQKEDKSFINALNQLAVGEMSNEDIALIKSRETNENDIPTDTIRLYTENRLVDIYNEKRINMENGVAYVSKAKDSILGNISSKLRNKLLTSLKNKKRTECGGLPYKITLKVGINYMITSNVDVQDGLVNGACAKLIYISFIPETQEPIKLWLDFNNPNVGINQRRPYLKYMSDNCINEHLVPLSHTSIVLNVNERLGYQVTRQQFPITPAEALTVHKSQGQTYEKVCIDTRKSTRLTRSMLYVALSRVTRLSGLYILGNFTPPKKPGANNSLELEMKRLKQEKGLQLSYTQVIQGSWLKIIYQNVRSLKKYICHIICDDWYKQADVLIFSETQTVSTDILQLDGFTIGFRSDSPDTRSSKGIICYIREQLNITVQNHIQKEIIQTNGQHHHIDLVHLKIKDVEIITGYKSPNIDRKTFSEKLLSIIKNITGNAKVLIGDFNYDAYKESGYIEKLLLPLNFKRGIPIEVSTTNFNTQIDVIFVDKIMSNFTTGVYETYFSDHKPVFIGLNRENTSIASDDSFRIHIDELTINTHDYINLEEKEQLTPTNNLTSLINTTRGIDFILENNQNKSTKIIRNKPIVKPQTMEENILEADSWLDDRTINCILNIIENNSQFNPNDVIVLQLLTWIEPVLEEEDLQIIGVHQSLHWRCIYFDRFKLHIYDSLYCDTLSYESLEEKEKKFIQIRYPHVSKNDIIIENVTQQPDLNSCGIYAAAFATSIALGDNPSAINYSKNANQMRKHLLRIINENILLPFPEE